MPPPILQTYQQSLDTQVDSMAVECTLSTHLGVDDKTQPAVSKDLLKEKTSTINASYVASSNGKCNINTYIV